MISLHFYLAMTLSAEYNQPQDVLIGHSSPPYGGVILRDDYSTVILDLNVGCGAAPCPSVLIFGAKQWGTINVINCKTGRTYSFINKSTIDLGIVLQQSGGRYGSKAIARFDLITCFCTIHGGLEYDEDEEEIPNGGILLCR